MKSLYQPNRRTGQSVRRMEKVKRRAWRRLTAVGLPVLLLAAAMTAGFGGGSFGWSWMSLWLQDSSLFRLEQVQIRGNRSLSEERLLQGAGLSFGESLIGLDLEAVRSRLTGHPLVRDAAVRRRLPTGIVIDLEERTPAAVVQGRRRYIVDADGYVMSRAGDEGEIPLPCLRGLDVDGNRIAAGALDDLRVGIEIAGVIQSTGFPAPGEVMCIDLGDESDAVIVPVKGWPLVHVGREKIGERLRRWRLVAPDIASRWGAVEYIDLRADGMVVAKPSEPSGEDAVAGKKEG